MCSRDLSYLDTLQNVSLTPLQQSILQKRYVLLVQEFAFRCLLLSILFHSSRFIVTVGSLIVPALLSIQYTDAAPGVAGDGSLSYRIYWTTWVISLLVTTCNGIQTIFKLEKKYYFLHTTLEQLRSEGWLFLELSGRYSGYFTPTETPTHENQFIFFCATVEKIKMKQVEEEYWKVNEAQQRDAQTMRDLSGARIPGQLTISQLIPPTPMKPSTNIVYDRHTPVTHTLVTIQESPEEDTPRRNSSTTIGISSQDEQKQNQKNKNNTESVPVSIVLHETTDGGQGNVLVPPQGGVSPQKPTVRF